MTIIQFSFDDLNNEEYYGTYLLYQYLTLGVPEEFAGQQIACRWSHDADPLGDIIAINSLPVEERLKRLAKEHRICPDERWSFLKYLYRRYDILQFIQVTYGSFVEFYNVIAQIHGRDRVARYDHWDQYQDENNERGIFSEWRYKIEDGDTSYGQWWRLMDYVEDVPLASVRA